MITAKNAVTGRIVFGKPMAEIKVSEIEGGYKITVTDPNGTQELDIMHGKDGKGGLELPEGLSILTVKTE